MYSYPRNRKSFFFFLPEKSHISEIAAEKEVKFFHKLTVDGDVG